MKNRELVKMITILDEKLLKREQVSSVTLEYYLIETREGKNTQSRYGVEVVRRVTEHDQSVHTAVIGGRDLCWDREKMLQIIRSLKGTAHLTQALKV